MIIHPFISHMLGFCPRRPSCRSTFGLRLRSPPRQALKGYRLLPRPPGWQQPSIVLLGILAGDAVISRTNASPHKIQGKRNGSKPVDTGDKVTTFLPRCQSTQLVTRSDKRLSRAARPATACMCLRTPAATVETVGWHSATSLGSWVDLNGRSLQH